MPAIEVNQISYQHNRHPILEDVSFTLEYGEYIGLIGPNGAGKTTLINIMLELLPPSSGKIVKAPNLTIGYVPQSYSLTPIIPISVEEVLSMSGYHNKKKHLHSLGQVNMDGSLLKKSFHHLSAGQQQRVIIARSLCINPQMLIFDEPLSGVDFSTRIKIYDLLAQLNEENQLTILFVSHEIERIIDKCHRILCLNKTLHQGCHPLDFSKGKIECTEEKHYQGATHHRELPVHHHHH